MDELHYLEIAELARLLAARKVSPVELTEALLRRIERLDPALASRMRWSRPSSRSRRRARPNR